MNRPEVNVRFTATDVNLGDTLKMTEKEAKRFKTAFQSGFSEGQSDLLKAEATTQALADKFGQASISVEELDGNLAGVARTFARLTGNNKINSFLNNLGKLGITPRAIGGIGAIGIAYKAALEPTIEMMRQVREETAHTTEELANEQKLSQAARVWGTAADRAFTPWLKGFEKLHNRAGRFLGATGGILGILGDFIPGEGASPGSRARDSRKMMEAQNEALRKGNALVRDRRSQWEKILEAQQILRPIAEGAGPKAIEAQKTLAGLRKEQLRLIDEQRIKEAKADKARLDALRKQADAIRKTSETRFESLQRELQQIDLIFRQLRGNIGQLTQEERQKARRAAVDEAIKPFLQDIERAQTQRGRIAERFERNAERIRDLRRRRAEIMRTPDFRAQFVGLTDISRRIQASAMSRVKDPRVDQVKAIDKQTNKLIDEQRKLQKEHHDFLQREREARDSVARFSRGV